MEKKFIKTTDKQTADKLITYGFKLVSQVGNIYTFINEMPQNFSFTNFDKSKIAYSNILSM